MLTPPAAGGRTPQFTVAICTWNRSTSLRRTLESHAQQRVPAGLRWELIVVDNNSTDDTAQVIAGFADRLPVRRVFEPCLGLSHARNAAVAAAQGEYILWTDDDVFVSPNWIASYAAAVRRWPDAALFGGPIRPHFEPDPPAWLARALPDVGHALALLDLGPVPIALDAARLPFGANYVIRAAEQRQHGYSPALGRVGTGMGIGEETAVARAVIDAGGAGWWVPDATVEHLILPDRQTLAYLRRYYVGAAISFGYDPAPDMAMLFGRPRWAWRQALECETRYRVSRWAGAPPERWAYYFKRASQAWGILQAPAVNQRRRQSSAAFRVVTETIDGVP